MLTHFFSKGKCKFINSWTSITYRDKIRKHQYNVLNFLIKQDKRRKVKIFIIQYIKDFPTELKRSDLGDLRVLLINSEW